MARKAKKYTVLRGTVPELPQENVVSEREQEIRTLADARRGKAMKELAQEYQLLKEEQKFAELEAESRNIKYEALGRVILEELKKVEEMAGTDTWRGEGQTFSPKPLLIPIVEDRAKLRQWIEDTHQTSLLTLPDPRLKSICAEAFESSVAAVLTPEQRSKLKAGDAGSMQPPPGVKVFLKTVVHRSEHARRANVQDVDSEVRVADQAGQGEHQAQRGEDQGTEEGSLT